MADDWGSAFSSLASVTNLYAIMLACFCCCCCSPLLPAFAAAAVRRCCLLLLALLLLLLLLLPAAAKKSLGRHDRGFGLLQDSRSLSITVSGSDP
jgi:hypothetical protein